MLDSFLISPQTTVWHHDDLSRVAKKICSSYPQTHDRYIYEPCHDLFVLRLNVTVNNLSVMLGRIRVMRKPVFANAKTKVQINCAVTVQLISAFVFPIQLVQPLFFLNSKFQASSNPLLLYSPVCVILS